MFVCVICSWIWALRQDLKFSNYKSRVMQKFTNNNGDYLMIVSLFFCTFILQVDWNVFLRLIAQVN